MGAEGAVVTLQVTPRVCPAGQPAVLKGTIMVHDKAQSYSIRIETPDKSSRLFNGQTDAKGAFTATFTETEKPGWYKLEAVAADGKGRATDSLFVSSPEGVATAYHNRINALLSNAVKQVSLSLQYLQQMNGTAGLEENCEKLRSVLSRIGLLKQRAAELSRQFNQVLELIQPSPATSQAMARHQEALSAWTQQADEVLPSLEQQQQQYQNISNRCEAINAVTELCGLASWIMNFQGGLAKIMLNIASDKVLPGLVDRKDWTGSDAEKESRKFAINETQKGMTAAAMGMKELLDFIKGGGLMGDILQFVSKVLYAQNCVDLKGIANAQFNARMFDRGELYWRYGVHYKGTLTLRYEKTANLSQPVEITGEFEGYKSKYDFWEKIELVEPFPQAIRVVNRIRKMPAVINSSPVSGDLGLAGRTLTPGTYRVKVKGKLVNNQLTLEVIRSPFDFTERIEQNRMHLIGVVVPMPVPLVKTFTFPIARARAAFVVGLGENKPLSLKEQDDKLTLKQLFINSRTLGSKQDIKLETRMELDVSN